MSDKNLSKGDKVSWETRGNKTTGKVTDKITSDTSIGGHTAKASEDDPQFEVKSDKSGKSAIHKPESIDKI